MAIIHRHHGEEDKNGEHIHEGIDFTQDDLSNAAEHDHDHENENKDKGFNLRDLLSGITEYIDSKSESLLEYFITASIVFPYLVILVFYGFPIFDIAPTQEWLMLSVGLSMGFAK